MDFAPPFRTWWEFKRDFFCCSSLSGWVCRKYSIDTPSSYLIIKWLGAAYLLYLAWGIAVTNEPSSGGSGKESGPMGFFGASAFQLINPKAWVMAVSAYAIYVPAVSGYLQVIMVAAAFTAIGIPSSLVWVLFVLNLRKVLRVPTCRRIFNAGMAIALVASSAPLLRTSK